MPSRNAMSRGSNSRMPKESGLVHDRPPSLDQAMSPSGREMSTRRPSGSWATAVSDISWSVDTVQSNSQVLPLSAERQKATMSCFASGVRP